MGVIRVASKCSRHLKAQRQLLFRDTVQSQVLRGSFACLDGITESDITLIEGAYDLGKGTIEVDTRWRYAISLLRLHWSEYYLSFYTTLKICWRPYLGRMEIACKHWVSFSWILHALHIYFSSTITTARGSPEWWFSSFVCCCFTSKRLLTFEWLGQLYWGHLCFLQRQPWRQLYTWITSMRLMAVTHPHMVAFSGALANLMGLKVSLPYSNFPTYFCLILTS